MVSWDTTTVPDLSSVRGATVRGSAQVTRTAQCNGRPSHQGARKGPERDPPTARLLDARENVSHGALVEFDRVQICTCRQVDRLAFVVDSDYQSRRARQHRARILGLKVWFEAVNNHSTRGSFVPRRERPESTADIKASAGAVNMPRFHLPLHGERFTRLAEGHSPRFYGQQLVRDARNRGWPFCTRGWPDVALAGGNGRLLSAASRRTKRARCKASRRRPWPCTRSLRRGCCSSILSNVA